MDGRFINRCRGFTFNGNTDEVTVVDRTRRRADAVNRKISIRNPCWIYYIYILFIIQTVFNTQAICSKLMFSARYLRNPSSCVETPFAFRLFLHSAVIERAGFIMDTQRRFQKQMRLFSPHCNPGLLCTDRPTAEYRGGEGGDLFRRLLIKRVWLFSLCRWNVIEIRSIR